MDEVKFENGQNVVDKYRHFIYSLPGFVYVGYNDCRIMIYVKPKELELTKRFVANKLDGIPVIVEARTSYPHF